MQERKDDSRRTYTVEQTADILGIGLNQAYEAAARGDIPALRIGRRWVVPKLAFDRLLDPAAPAAAVAPNRQRQRFLIIDAPE